MIAGGIVAIIERITDITHTRRQRKAHEAYMLQHVLREQKLSWTEVYEAAQLLSKCIQQTKRPVTTIVAVARGGLVPAGMIARAIGCHDIRVIGVSSYSRHHEQVAEDEIKLTNTDNLHKLDTNSTLVVDDLVDTGRTFKMLRELFLPSASYAALYCKPKGFSKDLAWGRSIPQRTWLVFPWETD